MKLYHFARTRSSRPLWTAIELGLELEIQPIDLTKGEAHTKEFLDKNPHGKLPVLEDDKNGICLIESGAICLYLLDQSKTPDKLLPPNDTKNRAMCYQWTVYAAATLDDMTIPPYLQKNFVPEDKRDNAMIEKAATAWKETFAPYLSKHLGEKEFLCGAKFTLADIMIGYDLFFANALGLIENTPNLQKYLERISSRDGFKKSFTR